MFQIYVYIGQIIPYDMLIFPPNKSPNSLQCLLSEMFVTVDIFLNGFSHPLVFAVCVLPPAQAVRVFVSLYSSCGGQCRLCACVL